jgi:hypothetical protein
MAIDQPGQQRRAGAVIDHFHTVGRRLDWRYLQDRADITDEDLAGGPHGLTIEDQPRPEDPHKTHGGTAHGRRAMAPTPDHADPVAAL